MWKVISKFVHYLIMLSYYVVAIWGLYALIKMWFFVEIPNIFTKILGSICIGIVIWISLEMNKKSAND